MSLDNQSTRAAQESALDRVQRIYETQGAEAADAELRRIRDEREAREASGQPNLDEDLDPEWADAAIKAVSRRGEEPPPEPMTEEEADELLSGFGAAVDKLEASEAKAELLATTPAIKQPDDWGQPIDPIGDLEIIRKNQPWAMKKRQYLKEDERKRRATKTARQRRWRAGQKAKKPPLPAKPSRFPVDDVTPEMEECFAKYVRAGDTYLARSLRDRFRVRNLIIALKTFLTMAADFGRDPTLTEFRRAMRWASKSKAQRAVEILSKVFDENGFGTAAELAKWTEGMAAER